MKALLLVLVCLWTPLQSHGQSREAQLTEYVSVLNDIESLLTANPWVVDIHSTKNDIRLLKSNLQRSRWIIDMQDLTLPLTRSELWMLLEQVIAKTESLATSINRYDIDARVFGEARTKEYYGVQIEASMSRREAIFKQLLSYTSRAALLGSDLARWLNSDHYNKNRESFTEMKQRLKLPGSVPTYGDLMLFDSRPGTISEYVSLLRDLELFLARNSWIEETHKTKSEIEFLKRNLRKSRLDIESGQINSVEAKLELWMSVEQIVGKTEGLARSLNLFHTDAKRFSEESVKDRYGMEVPPEEVRAAALARLLKLTTEIVRSAGDIAPQLNPEHYAKNRFAFSKMKKKLSVPERGATYGDMMLLESNRGKSCKDLF